MEEARWGTWAPRRWSRRALLRASLRAGLGVAGLALLSCSERGEAEEAGPTTPAPAPEPPPEHTATPVASAAAAPVAGAAAAEEPATDGERSYGGTLRLALPLDELDSPDPHRAGAAASQEWMGLAYNGLIRWRDKEAGVLESDIASLPEMPDGETYIFRLDRGARFWDRAPTEGGRLVTAQDVLFNLQRQIEALDAAGQADETFLRSAAYRRTASIKVVDDQTVVLKSDGIDASYLTSVQAAPFAWITAPEAAEAFGDRWRDATGEVALSAGSGSMIPASFSGGRELVLERNPGYWRRSETQALPYLERVVWRTHTTPEQAEAAYRSGRLELVGFPLSKAQLAGIAEDFPDHQFREVPSGFTVQARFNYHSDWAGADGLGNPWRDRRLAYAFHLAIDRFLLMETLYGGDARLSVSAEAPWFTQGWTIPPEELAGWPGYRRDRENDQRLIQELIEAAGFDRGRRIPLVVPEPWERTFPGIAALMESMYRQATGLDVVAEVQPYAALLQQLEEGRYPGDMPSWTNPPEDLDPTTAFTEGLLPAGRRNFLGYDYAPVTELVERMRRTLATEERQRLAQQVLRISAGQDLEHGLAGMGPSVGVMNGIQRLAAWPYVHIPAEAFQYAHASHHHERSWLDATQPASPTA